MTTIEQIQTEIEALPEEDFARLRRWFAEKDWELWDRPLKYDVAAGRLDSFQGTKRSIVCSSRRP